MSALPDLPSNVAEIAAPLLLGTAWNWTLYGVLLVQIYVYSYNFPGDRKLLKLLVYGIFFLETLQTALSGADLYYWFASGFGNLNHLTNPYAAAFDVPIIGTLVSLTVQFFFAYRVWKLSNRSSWWLCVIISICVCSTVDTAAAFAGGVYSHITRKFAAGRPLRTLALTWLIGNTVTDILITTAMLYHLTRRRSSNGDGPFCNPALSKIVRLTVETNVLTSTVGVVSLVMVTAFPDRNWYACPTAILGKVYSNTLLVSLNNRISIREEMSAKEALHAPQTMRTPPPRAPTGFVHVELDQISYTSKERSQSGAEEGRGGVEDDIS